MCKSSSALSAKKLSLLDFQTNLIGNVAKMLSLFYVDLCVGKVIKLETRGIIRSLHLMIFVGNIEDIANNAFSLDQICSVYVLLQVIGQISILKFFTKVTSFKLVYFAARFHLIIHPKISKNRSHTKSFQF